MIHGEYAPIVVRGRSLGALSLVFFVASLFARYLVAAVAPADMHFFRRAFLTALAVPILAGVGLLLGLVGSRLSGHPSPSHQPGSRGDGRNLARLGMWLNLVVVVLAGLALFAFYRIMPDGWTPLRTR